MHNRVHECASTVNTKAQPKPAHSQSACRVESRAAAQLRLRFKRTAHGHNHDQHSRPRHHNVLQRSLTWVRINAQCTTQREHEVTQHSTDTATQGATALCKRAKLNRFALLPAAAAAARPAVAAVKPSADPGETNKPNPHHGTKSRIDRTYNAYSDSSNIYLSFFAFLSFFRSCRSLTQLGARRRGHVVRTSVRPIQSRPLGLRRLRSFSVFLSENSRLYETV